VLLITWNVRDSFKGLPDDLEPPKRVTSLFNPSFTTEALVLLLLLLCFLFSAWLLVLPLLLLLLLLSLSLPALWLLRSCDSNLTRLVRS
jgi:hypothetical protein